MGPRKRSVEPGFGSRDHGSTSMPPLGSFRAETRASFYFILFAAMVPRIDHDILF